MVTCSPVESRDIELAGVGTRLNVSRKSEQAIGLAAHRGDHDDDVVAPVAGASDPGGDPCDALQAPHRGYPRTSARSGS